MVVALGPGKFYGSSLPRPRIYTDVKFNDQRVDPPVPVLDPLLQWAEEAHWSMGGLNHHRLRMQGKIEGNVKKLKKEKEKWVKMHEKVEKSRTPVLKSGSKSRKLMTPGAPVLKKRKSRVVESLLDDEESESDEESEDEVEERENGEVKRKRRRLVRKLGDDFELVAKEKGNGDGGVEVRVSEGVGTRTRARSKRWRMVLPEEEEEEEEEAVVESKSEKIGREKKVGLDKEKKDDGKKGSGSPVNSNGTRSSPRLKKKSS